MSKFTPLLFLFISFFGFSQSTLIGGKVSYQGTYQKNIDVINFTTKKITQTNALGEFLIDAKTGDILIFMSNTFADQKYKLSAEDFQKKALVITLAEKPVPLEEVEITQVKAIKMAGVSYNDAKTAKIEKDAARPKTDVYTGEIINGVDVVQVGKMIGKLFKSKNPKSKVKEVPMSFKDYAVLNFNQSFFTKTLKLKPEETSRFVEYCDQDPKSKEVIKDNDELAILQFLLDKKTEFDKLK